MKFTPSQKRKFAIEYKILEEGHSGSAQCSGHNLDAFTFGRSPFQQKQNSCFFSHKFPKYCYIVMQI